MSPEKRPYRKRARAEAEAATRQRIVEAALKLHMTLGPAATSIKALAEAAGVPRSTIYRHFADEAAIIDACNAHFLERTPPPDPSGWPAITDPDARLRIALAEVYGYYRRAAPMLERSLRDAAVLPALARQLDGFSGFLHALRAILVDGRTPAAGAKRQFDAALGHALAFQTWQSLTQENGLADAEAVDLMARLVDAAESPRAGQ
jgi:AcrR family transcriptional regulator